MTQELPSDLAVLGGAEGRRLGAFGNVPICLSSRSHCWDLLPFSPIPRVPMACALPPLRVHCLQELCPQCTGATHSHPVPSCSHSLWFAALSAWKLTPPLTPTPGQEDNGQGHHRVPPGFAPTGTAAMALLRAAAQGFSNCLQLLHWRARARPAESKCLQPARVPTCPSPPLEASARSHRRRHIAIISACSPHREPSAATGILKGLGTALKR